jgi:hypothetical protein
LFEASNHPGKYADFIIAIAEEVESLNDLYTKVDSNSINDICLWERKEKLKYKQVLKQNFKNVIHSKDEYFELGELAIDSINSNYFLIDIEFDIDAIELPFNGLLILHATDEETNQRLRYESYSIGHQKSFKTDTKFRQRIVLKKLHPTHKLKISTYIWNLKKETISISNGKTIFYQFLN